jgi:hypothetical protein
MRIGKNLALLQAEASACVLEFANVPNVRWRVVLSMKHNDTCMKRPVLRLRQAVLYTLLCAVFLHSSFKKNTS